MSVTSVLTIVWLNFKNAFLLLIACCRNKKAICWKYLSKYYISKMDDIHSDQAVIVVPGNVPEFLLKLWNILENPAYDTLISWNQVKKIYFTSKSGNNSGGYDCFPLWDLILEPFWIPQFWVLLFSWRLLVSI